MIEENKQEGRERERREREHGSCRSAGAPQARQLGRPVVVPHGARALFDNENLAAPTTVICPVSPLARNLRDLTLVILVRATRYAC